MIKINFSFQYVETRNDGEALVLCGFKKVVRELSKYGLEGTARKLYSHPLTFVISISLGLKKLKITLRQHVKDNGDLSTCYVDYILEDNCGNIRTFTRDESLYRAIKKEIKNKNERQFLINQEISKTYKRILKNL